MKIFFAIATAILLVWFNSRAGIIAGPITNPQNGHDYYLLSASTWTASEAEAEHLGGTLAIVKSAAEEEWIFSKFGAYGKTNRNLWIGLRRESPGGAFKWVTGEKVNFSNWADNQPDNGGGVEDCVHIIGKLENWPAGKWNDIVDNGSACGVVPNGVVEMPGAKSTLSDKERSLLGTWYHNGDASQPCWITSEGGLLFAINNDNEDASRMIYLNDGYLFSPKWRQYAEIVQDRILWANGIWWSRRPVNYAVNADTDEAK